MNVPVLCQNAWGSVLTLTGRWKQHTKDWALFQDHFNKLISGDLRHLSSFITMKLFESCKPKDTWETFKLLTDERGSFHLNEKVDIDALKTSFVLGRRAPDIDDFIKKADVMKALSVPRTEIVSPVPAHPSNTQLGNYRSFSTICSSSP